MRYLSEDGKVFNSEKECNEHEIEIKKQETESKKVAEQRKDLEDLMNLVEKTNKMIDEMDNAMTAYEKKWGVSFGRYGTGSGSLLKSLAKDFLF